MTATTAGAGRGAVVSTVDGINCPPTCNASWLYGTSVTLNAKVGTGSRFVGWSGACSGTGPCVLAVTANRAVTATFALPLPASVHCKVPKVVGLTLAKARSKIARAHCRVGKVGRKRVVRKKRGKVLAQTPRAGRSLTRGAKVSLTVGK